MSERVILDPSEVATGRTEFDLFALSGIHVDQSGIDWGQAAIDAYLADQRYGSQTVDFRVPNRTVTIPLGLGMDDSGSFRDARRALQQKVGLMFREGGWLKRELADGTKMYADVESASLTMPEKLAVSADLEQDVALVLDCRPDFYGDEITLDSMSATGVLAGVLQQSGEQAVVEGDHPARCRIKLTTTGATFAVTIASPGVFTASAAHALSPGDTIVFSTTGSLPTGLLPQTVYYVIATGLTTTQFEVSATANGAAIATTGAQSGVHSYHHDQRGAFWAFRARHYDSATSAKLFYEAEALTPLDAAATFAHSGFSGGSTMRHNSLPAGTWCPVLLTDIFGGGVLTHKGSYRVRARVYSATATPQLRLLWGIGDVAHPVPNDPVTVPAAGAPYIVDLGQVRLDMPPTPSAYCWKGVIQALAAVQNDPIEIDCLYLAPFDESAGDCQAVQTPPTLGINLTQLAGSTADQTGVGTLTWTNPALAAADDGQLATQNTGGTTHYLRSAGHAFAIPAGATISGIQVDIKRGAPTPTGPYTGPPVDNRVRLVRAGTVETVGDHADTITPWPPTITWKSYGGPTDLWGAAWTPADVNSATFGAVLSAILPGAGPVPACVDAMRITVYYTTSGGFTVSSDAILFADRHAEFRTEGMYREDYQGARSATIGSDGGDLPRLPPSGLEARAVEILLKLSRGDLAAAPDTVVTDSFTAQMIYRPCYLTLP